MQAPFADFIAEITQTSTGLGHIICAVLLIIMEQTALPSGVNANIPPEFTGITLSAN
jgi:hypothetical protein